MSGAEVRESRARVVAFPCAGSAEDMYSVEGTGVRKAASPLLVSERGGWRNGAHLRARV